MLSRIYKIYHCQFKFGVALLKDFVKAFVIRIYLLSEDTRGFKGFSTSH